MAQNKLYFETAKEVAEEKGVSVEDIYESTRKSFIYGKSGTFFD